MKNLTLQLPDGTPAPTTEFGNVPPGTTTVQRELRLVNTGDEPITGDISLRALQDNTIDGTYIASAGGISLSANWQVVATNLAVGASILVLEAWQVPSTTSKPTGLDNGWLEWRFYS